MKPIDKTDLMRFANRARQDYIDALAVGWSTIEAAGINTELRWCHFIAQVAHETGGLRIVREDTGWTPGQMKALWPQRFPLGAADPRIVAARGNDQALANLAYSGRSDIGNQGGDDGWDYRGGSFLQLTGRAAYTECGAAIGIDLESEPELIEQAEIGLAVALWTWAQHPNNELADHNYGRAIGNAINRGNPWSAKEPIGYDSRRKWFNRAWALWGEGLTLPDDSVLHLGAYGPKVSNLQATLKALNYPVGATDGVFGPALARAVAGFKLDQQRLGGATEPAETVGPLTLAALESASPAPLSADRTTATVADLAAVGSTEVASGQKAKGTGQALLYTGAAAGASEVGLLEPVKDALGWLPGAQTLLAPVISAVQWGLKNALWVAVIVLGVWMWVKGKDVILARLRAHRTGANLGR